MNNELIGYVKNRIIDILHNNFIGAKVFKIDTPIVDIKYIDFDKVEEVEPANYNTFPSKLEEHLENSTTKVLSLGVQSKVLQVQDFQISASYTRSQVEELKNNYNINLQHMISDTLINEFESSVNKKIISVIDKNADFLENTVNIKKEIPLSGIKKFINDILIFLRILKKDKSIFKRQFEYIKTNVGFDIKYPQELINKINVVANLIAVKCRRGPGNFVVCNTAIAMLLRDHPNFVVESMKTINGMSNISSSKIYKVGMLGNIKVFVDPYMAWDDDYFYIGRQDTEQNVPGLNIGYIEDSIKLQEIVVEGTMAPKMVLSNRMFIEDVSGGNKDRFVKVRYNPSAIMI